MGWTASDFTRARVWKAQGLSATQIGRRLGKTRNAVIGKLSREGFALTSGEALDALVAQRINAKLARVDHVLASFNLDSREAA